MGTVFGAAITMDIGRSSRPRCRVTCHARERREHCGRHDCPARSRGAAGPHPIQRDLAGTVYFVGVRVELRSGVSVLPRDDHVVEIRSNALPVEREHAISPPSFVRVIEDARLSEMPEEFVREARRIRVVALLFREKPRDAPPSIDRMPEREVPVWRQPPLRLRLRHQWQESCARRDGVEHLLIHLEIGIDPPARPPNHRRMHEAGCERNRQPYALRPHRSRRDSTERQQDRRQQPPHVHESRAVEPVWKDQE